MAQILLTCEDGRYERKVGSIKNLLKLLIPVLALLLAGILTGCGSDGDTASKKTLYIGGVPDQDTSLLVRRFDGVADYLSGELGVNVRYRSSIDYAAVVTAFASEDIHLAWFGGLTGVQARKAAPGAQAIAQRPSDAEFTSVFIVGKDIPAQGLQDLADLTFTFGSVSSTSGHLMPRHFLIQAGLDPETDFNSLPNFSGSHHATWKLVESGSYQAGALNQSVWANAVSDGRVDTAKVRELEITPPYYDYNWSARPDLDESFGSGFTQRLKDALLNMHKDPDQAEILKAFRTEAFIETNNGNYEAIEDVAKMLGMVE